MVTLQAFLALCEQITYICSSLKACSSSFWNNLKSFIVSFSLLFKCMIKWAMKFWAIRSIFAWVCFVKVWMKLELLPAMCLLALSTRWATLIIVGDIGFRVPLITLSRIIEVEMPFSSKVLPVVGIHTRWSIV